MFPSTSSQKDTKIDASFSDNPNDDYPTANEASIFVSPPPLLRHQILFLTIFFALIGFLLPNFYAHKNGFPVPHVHDEFSYLLAADTFANGRITNPTPEFYEHFESPHILVAPTYASKFPPAQGLILALGQIIFGQPIYGVWISCGLFSAALFWMLTVWYGFRRAILGTAIMLFFVGTNSYWAQSFWGGSMAAFGGCVFFGSFRQLLKNFSAAGFLLLVFGGTVMLNSRPFEGLLTMLPPLIFLFFRFVKDNSFPFFEKFRRFVLPSFLLAIGFISAMSYYNFRVTGDAFTFPYTIHQKQYFSTPLFAFQTPLQSELRGTPRLRNLYEQLSSNEPLKYLYRCDVPQTRLSSSIFAVFYLLANIPYFLVSASFAIVLFAFLFFVLKNDESMRIVALTFFLTVIGMSLATYWERPHYAATLAACVYLLLIASLKCGGDFLRKHLKEKHILFSAVVLSLCFYKGYGLAAAEYYNPPLQASGAVYELEKLETDGRATLAVSLKATYLKPEIEKYFDNLPDKYLILVSYTKDQSVHQEIVYNESDIENSKLIWAYDLGAEKNKNLIEHFGDRKIIYVDASPDRMNFDVRPSEK